ncbi:MAG: hypothetical protein KH128_12885, partial [Firmicutes bacterium]|nr:hypothetical protein [Bacillota bacterium]
MDKNGSTAVALAAVLPYCVVLTFRQSGGIIPSLTVRKRKNRCIPHVYWGIAIFVVVSKYS